MAETMTATSWPASTSRLTWPATLRMRSTLATLVPPNFRTRRAISSQGSGLTRQRRGAYRGGSKAGQRQENAMLAASLKPDEVARFDALAQDWWNPDGPMAPLHKINPVRIGWLIETLARRFKAQGSAPLAGRSILDIGCGAGLLSEPLSRLGAEVTGLDPAPAAIAAAR